MRIAIITSDPNLDSSQRLAAAARARGHEVVALELLRLSIRTSTPRVLYHGEEIAALDGAMIRLGSVLPGLALAAGRALEQDGVALLDSIDGLWLARDKMESLQRLASVGIAVPETELVRDLDQLDGAIERLGGAPVVVKPLHGSQGRGVVLAENSATAVSMMESVLFQSREFILQRYIECGGRDLRMMVVGGEVVAAMERTAPAGDFRSNLHRGGQAKGIEPAPETAQLACRAVEALGLCCGGVDVIEGPGGPWVLEVNGSPGLTGIETVTGIAVAEKMFEVLEQRIREGAHCEQG